MSNQILEILKRKSAELSDLGGVSAETRRNVVKEELQFYVLNFIYRHPMYSTWIMYGGSALRIIHQLDRLSVDLDFEIPLMVTDKLLLTLKQELIDYFANDYGAGADFLTIKVTAKRGLLLKFQVDEKLGGGYSSKQVHVKIDLNAFVAPKTVTERWPINHGQLSFVIVTYNMAALMASKLAAIFLRGKRGVGKDIYGEKGRDIYDLLWYMNKRVVPDFDYLVAKKIDLKNPRDLFDKLTVQMNRVNDKNLKQDLSPLFIDQTQIAHWLQNWRESYLRLLDDYKIHQITKLKDVEVRQDFLSDVYSFIFRYQTTDGNLIKIIYVISDYWFNRGKDGLSADIKPWASTVIGQLALTDEIRQYVTLFHQKSEKYLRKTNQNILGDSIITKMIRLTADNFDPKEHVILNRSALLSCELDDLLR